ncbi:acyltransferase [Desulfosediminicola flagellatus]|uniref:acyltransferase n=1 Tax=Desulfosediminicola flagellatus TaxID=2569541 RepID=UPI0010AD4349|nr:acyltransferase [Desulfosediminicola flagellatus]
MSTSYYSKDELQELGLGSFGENVLISRFARIYKPESIDIGNNVRIDDFCIISGGSGIRIGSYIHIAPHVSLYGEAGIILEDFSGISSRSVLYTATDDYSGRSLTNPMVPIEFKPRYVANPIVLRKHSIVGTNSTILPGVELGEGAAVGAHSLITKSCEPWSIFFGAPAKRIKARSKNLLELEAQFKATLNEQ